MIWTGHRASGNRQGKTEAVKAGGLKLAHTTGRTPAQKPDTDSEHSSLVGWTKERLISLSHKSDSIVACCDGTIRWLRGSGVTPVWLDWTKLLFRYAAHSQDRPPSNWGGSNGMPLTDQRSEHSPLV